MMNGIAPTPSLSSVDRSPEFHTQEQALDFGRQFFANMLAKAFYQAPSSMDEDSAGNGYEPLMRQIYADCLADSGVFDHQANALMRRYTGGVA